MGFLGKAGPKGVIVLAIALVSLLVFTSWVALSYNAFVRRDTAVLAQWAQVENVYQRKIDLIPELRAVALNYTQFERSVLENITRLRSQWQNASGIDQRINYSNSIDQNLYTIWVTYEAYPELKSAYLLAGLMDSYSEAENMIAVERMRFNEAVRVYNTQVRSFPDAFVANSFGFREHPYYDPIPGGPGGP